MIAMLVSLAMEAIINSSVQRCASVLAEKPEGLRLIDAAISEPLPQPNFEYCLRGEAYMNLVVDRNAWMRPLIPNTNFQLDSQPKNAAFNVGIPADLPGRALMGKDLEYWNQVHAALSTCQDDPLLQSKKLSEVTAQFSQDNYTGAFRKIETPSFDNVGESIVADRAGQLVNQCLLKALELRAAGRSPQSLAEIPGIWMDPFSKAPLIFRTAKDTITVYSVGPDGRDNGGIARDDESHDPNSTDYDIVARYPPAVIRRQ
jgi:hypothetical protein